MTIEQRVDAIEHAVSKLSVNTLAEETPSSYYTSIYSGEEIDQAITDVRSGVVILPSSTSGSTKKFRLQVDDSGTITATEVTT